jgi:hypothetical protein
MLGPESARASTDPSVPEADQRPEMKDTPIFRETATVTSATGSGPTSPGPYLSKLFSSSLTGEQNKINHLSEASFFQVADICE